MAALLTALVPSPGLLAGPSPSIKHPLPLQFGGTTLLVGDQGSDPLMPRCRPVTVPGLDQFVAPIGNGDWHPKGRQIGLGPPRFLSLALLLLLPQHQSSLARLLLLENRIPGIATQKNQKRKVLYFEDYHHICVIIVS